MDIKEIGKVIRARREELKLTQDQVTALSGVSKPYLSNIETGRAKNPPTDVILAALEKALKFEAGDLVGMANLARTPADVRQAHEQLTAEVNRLRGVLRQLLHTSPGTAGVEGGEVETRELERLAREAMFKDDDADNLRLVQIGRAVPIINKVAAGYPQNFTDLDYPTSVADDYVRCPDVRDPQAFAARVSGDSMEPDYHQDDIVVFSPNTLARSGDDCFVRFDGDFATTFKRIYQDSETSIRLQPLNNRYPAQVFDRERITGLWPAVYRVERLRR